MRTQIDEEMTTKEFIDKYSWFNQFRDMGMGLKRHIKTHKLELENEQQ